MPADRTERYLRRATRGLIGQARRDAVAELRGAIDDKLYRLSLLGLSGEAALDRALKELGSPRQLAGGYAQVHTLPPALRAVVLSLLAGAAIFSFSSAQRVLQAVPYQLKTASCDFSEAGLRARPAEEAKAIRAAFAKFGGQQGMRRLCLAIAQRLNQYVKVSDVVQVFKEAGVTTRLSPSPHGYTFEFPGPQVASGFLSLDQPTEKFGAQEYTPISTLLNMLQSLPGVPLTLQGERNPVLNAGKVRLRLGSDLAPVWASAVYAAVIQDNVYAALKGMMKAGQPEMIVADFDQIALETGQSLRVPQTGLYALVGTVDEFATDASMCSCDYLLRVQRSEQGQLRLPLYGRPKTGYKLVGSYRDLVTAQARGERAVLVLRLNDAGDLRKLDPAPVAANLIHLEAPR